MKWSDLEPEPTIVDAINHAGEKGDAVTQNQKRRWSERFADGCAVAISNMLSNSPKLKDKKILPESLDGKTEPLTPLGGGTKKRIDVTVTDHVLGLELGISLKGLNFIDSSGNNYDKNLTGRLYELGDEVRVVHDHLPYAFMVGVFFLPIEAVRDKTIIAPSSFAKAVVKLRERSSRIDPLMFSQSSMCDASYVALYSVGCDAINKGVTRFFRVTDAPSRRGRPKVGNTISLSEMISEVIDLATYSSEVEWSEPEVD